MPGGDLETNESITTPDEAVKYLANLKGWQPKDVRVEEIALLDLSFGRRLTAPLRDATNANAVKKSIFEPHRLFRGRAGKVKVTIYKPKSIGAPAVVMRVEELIALGAKKILLLGIAGSLQPYLKVGDYAIPIEGIRDEGVSSHYLPRHVKARASRKIVSALEEACRKHRVNYRKGTTWSMGAIYREPKSRVLELQKRGVLTVEMEAAAVFSIAKFRGVEAGAFFCISDELAGLKWKLGFYSKKLQNAEKKMVDIVLDALQMFQTSPHPVF